MPQKIQKMIAIKSPKNKKQLQKFIEMINYYKDMYQKWAEIIASLTTVTGKNILFKWTNECQEAFNKIKAIIAKQTTLKFLDYNKPFIVYTDASNYQLGGVGRQHEQPVAFFSRKLNRVQQKYTTTDKELLSFAETLKEYNNVVQSRCYCGDQPQEPYASDHRVQQRLSPASTSIVRRVRSKVEIHQGQK